MIHATTAKEKASENRHNKNNGSIVPKHKFHCLSLLPGPRQQLAQKLQRYPGGFEEQACRILKFQREDSLLQLMALRPVKTEMFLKGVMFYS